MASAVISFIHEMIDRRTLRPKAEELSLRRTQSQLSNLKHVVAAVEAHTVTVR